jgi:hypothetical protein
LKIGELRRFLETLPNSADEGEVIVDGQTIVGTEIQIGRIQEGYLSDSFKKHEKGRVTALRFTRRTELSDGTIHAIPI